MDSYSPVSLAYFDRAPYTFNGKIDKLKINYLEASALSKAGPAVKRVPQTCSGPAAQTGLSVAGKYLSKPKKRKAP